MTLGAFLQSLVDDGALSPEEMEKGPLAVGAGGDMPLHYAAYAGNMVVGLSLLEAAAPINAPGEFGFTPLHCAAFRGNTAFVQVLLNAGANPCIRTVSGDTPLDLAISESNLACAEIIQRAIDGCV